MEFELYIDAYFLLNFLMNYIILTATKQLLRNECSVLLRIIGAAIGSIFVCISVLIPINNILILVILVYLIPSLFMTIISFKPVSGKQVVKQLLYLNSMSFLLGGTMQVIYNFTGVGYYISKFLKEGIGQLISLRVFLVLFLSGSGVLLGFTSDKRRTEDYDECIYTVELQHNNKSVKGYGLVDTGNSLRDPISKRPVIICEKEIVEKIIEPHILNILCKQNMGGYEMVDSFQEFGIRMIPYNAVGSANGMLVAITIDKITIRKNKERIYLGETLVAVYNNQLSGMGEFQMLLQPELIKK